MIFKAKSYNMLEIQEKRGGRVPLGTSPKSAYVNIDNKQNWTYQKSM